MSPNTRMMLPAVTDEALEGLKFSVCLPEDLARTVLQRRAHDGEALEWVRDVPTVTAG
jgi:hypothetical protein